MKKRHPSFSGLLCTRLTQSQKCWSDGKNVDAIMGFHCKDANITFFRRT
ncbi:hypothetical protein AVEN_127041-1, partial [Araneus ventricosus]